MLWNSISFQLAKENKKFIYGLVKEGSRAKDYEMALLWLIDCGLVYKINRVTIPKLPLKAYEDLKAFKLFMVDVGLLSCKVRLDKSILLDENKIFVEFKGALTEQYVLQQIIGMENLSVYYYTNNRSSAEIDFIVENGKIIIPIEVKAKTNLQAKSLKTYYEKFKPQISLRTSMANYKKDDWLINIPLWAISYLKNINI